jgi:hypothetical protein
VYSVLEPGNRKIFALKRVQLDRSDPETITNYLNEIDLLKRLSGHDRIIQLIDHSISYTPSGRPKILQMVSAECCSCCSAPYLTGSAFSVDDGARRDRFRRSVREPAGETAQYEFRCALLATSKSSPSVKNSTIS